MATSQFYLLARQGSVEIEHGTGSGGAGGDFFFEPTAKTASRHTADTRNVGGDADGGERDDIFDTARFSHFDRGGGSSGDRYSAAGAASGDAPFCSRESRWRLERLDGGSGGDGRRSLRGTWDSSVGGAVGPATGGTAAAAAAAARGATRIRDWRTEADADLSDIKATMQRLDGNHCDGHSVIDFRFFFPFLSAVYCEGRHALTRFFSDLIVVS